MIASKVSVAQMGARMHYAIPRILEDAGMLGDLFTDACASVGWPKLLNIVPKKMLPPSLDRFSARVPKGIPPEKITAFTNFGFLYASKLARAKSADARDEVFLWAGSEFGRLVNERGLGNAGAVYCYNTAGLEIFRQATRQGIRKIHEQTISPRKIEQTLMEEEEAAFPSWGPSSQGRRSHDLAAREFEEWQEADLILCASDYVKEGIAACGGDVGKCHVVPYGVERLSRPVERTTRAPGPIRIITVGAVGLRKGSPHVLEAAKLLKGVAEFRMIGPHHCGDSALKELRKHLHAPGAVPRSEISQHYSWADLYVLPSLCEGSATSTYEAMSHGLPVICTPHTGSILRDGIDGFIIPPRRPDLIAERVLSLAKSPERLNGMSAATMERAAMFTLDHYARNLNAVLVKTGIAAGGRCDL